MTVSFPFLTSLLYSRFIFKAPKCTFYVFQKSPLVGIARALRRANTKEADPDTSAKKDANVEAKIDCASAIVQGEFVI